MISTSLPCRTAEVTRSTDALFVGSVPDRNSALLFWPSPSGSALASACGQFVQPKYCNCQHVNGSPAVTLALPFIFAVQPLVTLDAITVYVPAAVWFVNEIALPVPTTKVPTGL